MLFWSYTLFTFIFYLIYFWFFIKYILLIYWVMLFYCFCIIFWLYFYLWFNHFFHFGHLAITLLEQHYYCWLRRIAAPRGSALQRSKLAGFSIFVTRFAPFAKCGFAIAMPAISIRKEHTNWASCSLQRHIWCYIWRKKNWYCLPRLRQSFWQG